MLACEHALFSEGDDPREPVVNPRLEARKNLEQRNSLEVYQHCVYSYSQMDLTYATNRLRAFEGIASTLRRFFWSPFIYGLPQTELESTLSWISGDGIQDAETVNNPFRRRRNDRDNKNFGPG
ncbi:hypothetical protein MMC21_008242 [Puttea exsequens]|nr:hypothetical protein [Puttea exsequens]